jgi:hypothetical protein
VKTLLVTLLCVLQVSCAFTRPLATKEDVLRYVQVIEDRPLSDDAVVAYSALVRFVAKTKDVTVIIDQRVLPWSGRGNTHALLGSFVAGNAASQIRKGANKDDTYSGLLLVFSTYKRMREINPDFHIVEIDDQIRLLERGELSKYVEDIYAKTK